MTDRPTMSAVARACGVSQATVSLVLNDAPGTRISLATRRTVRETAERLGYVLPRRTRAGGDVIGLVIDDVTCSPHAAALIDGAAVSAAEAQMSLVVVPTAGSDDAAFDQLDALGARGVLYARLVTQAVAPPGRLARRPAVLLNCHADGDPLPSVIPGDLAAAATATLALIDAGHSRVGHLAGEDSVEAARERLAGYRRALAMRDLPFDPALVVPDAWSPRRAADGLRRLVAGRDPATAVFCFCDRAAIGVYGATAALGLRIPDDLAIIGFDNETFAAELDPPLTTLELPHADMARRAVERLLGPLADVTRSSTNLREKLECPLIWRDSVASAPARSRATV